MIDNNRIGVSFILIPYNNGEKFRTRLERDLLPTIHAHPTWDFQFIIVDNSDEDQRACCRFFEDNELKHYMLWPGTNLMYGPAMNLALKACEYSYITYVCSNHGRMYNPTWIDDLINPMIEDEKIAMTGSHYASGCGAEHFGFAPHLPRIHIQGGIFGARTSIMKAYPYSSDRNWVHGASDIYQSYQLLNAGFILKDVPTIKSVWQQNLPSPQRWKFVHDYTEG